MMEKLKVQKWNGKCKIDSESAKEKVQKWKWTLQKLSPASSGNIPQDQLAQIYRNVHSPGGFVQKNQIYIKDLAGEFVQPARAEK